MCITEVWEESIRVCIFMPLNIYLSSSLANLDVHKDIIIVRRLAYTYIFIPVKLSFIKQLSKLSL